MAHAFRPVLSVLHVEDNASFRQGLAMLLNSTKGMVCRSACDGAAALRMVEEEVPDVVVMDIDLPGMSGIELTRHLKAMHPTLQVLMCTVFEDDDKIFQALKAGATGYIVKQAPIRELLDAIEQVCAGGSPMSPGIARRVVSTFHQATLAGACLTAREQAVIELIAEGLIVKEIGDRLGLSNSTVRTHIRHIYEKLQVHSRVEAVNKVRGA